MESLVAAFPLEERLGLPKAEGGLAYHPFQVEEASHPFRAVAALHRALVVAVMLLLVEAGL